MIVDNDLGLNVPTDATEILNDLNLKHQPRYTIQEGCCHLWHKIKEGSSVWSRLPACQVLFYRDDVSSTGTVTTCHPSSHLRQVSEGKDDTVSYLQRNSVKELLTLKKKKKLFKVKSASYV